MAAISDASPLILYSRIGRLDLLRELFAEVLIPQAVWDEIMIDGLDRPSARDIAQAPWIRVSPLTRPSPHFARRLDRGEGEVIGLALEAADPVQFVIMDDEQGRKEASERGLRIIGSAGIALLAKRESLADAARPIIIDLRTHGLYLSDEIEQFILRSAGE